MQFSAWVKRSSFIKGVRPLYSYELAKTFLNDEKIDVAKSLFTIVKGLEADYSEESKAILFQEYQHYLKGAVIMPFIENGKRADTEKKEIDKLARGIFDDHARRFIKTREEQFRSDHVLISINNIQRFKENPPEGRLRTFEDVISYYKSAFPLLIKQIFHDKPTEETAQGIAKHIDNHPAIRSAVMANIYLFFIQLVQKVVPATDKVDDHRHVIEASYNY